MNAGDQKSTEIVISSSFSNLKAATESYELSHPHMLMLDVRLIWCLPSRTPKMACWVQSVTQRDGTQESGVASCHMFALFPL